MQSKTEKKGQNSKNCDTNIIDFNTVPTIMPCCKMIIANNVSHGKLETVVYLEIINKDCRALLLILIEKVSKHRKNCECCPGHYLSTSVY